MAAKYGASFGKGNTAVSHPFGLHSRSGKENKNAENCVAKLRANEVPIGSSKRVSLSNNKVGTQSTAVAVKIKSSSASKKPGTWPSNHSIGERVPKNQAGHTNQVPTLCSTKKPGLSKILPPLSKGISEGQSLRRTRNIETQRKQLAKDNNKHGNPAVPRVSRNLVVSTFNLSDPNSCRAGVHLTEKYNCGVSNKKNISASSNASIARCKNQMKKSTSTEANFIKVATKDHVSIDSHALVQKKSSGPGSLKFVERTEKRNLGFSNSADKIQKTEVEKTNHGRSKQRSNEVKVKQQKMKVTEQQLKSSATGPTQQQLKRSATNTTQVPRDKNLEIKKGMRKDEEIVRTLPQQGSLDTRPFSLCR